MNLDVSNKPILDIENLCVAFREAEGIKTVVNSASLSLYPRQTLALVGESGSGKSVLAKSILKLLPEHSAIYSSGAIKFSGEDLLSLAESPISKIRGARIAMVFQEPMTSLNPLHSIEKQLAEVLFLHKGLSPKKARSTVLLWLEKVGINNAESRMGALPHELSGGERQRVVIAMALLAEPEVLIADEPTTALDVTIQKQILELLQSLQDELGMAVLFITHDLSIVRRIATRVAVMRLGEIVEEGDLHQVFDSPKHEYTKMLLSSSPGEAPKRLNREASDLLKVSGIRTWFPVKEGVFKRVVRYIKAVDDISFNLSYGETLGIVGESGSGKTTLGRSILKLSPSQGDIHFTYLENQKSIKLNVHSLSKNELKTFRSKCQIIFQDPFASLSPRMCVRDIIAEGLQVFDKLGAKALDEKVIAAMNDVQLDPASRYRYPNEFSGGQRQRISIARALILKPMLLVLDEPTSALDRSVQKDLIDLLKNLQARYHLSYIFISHDLNVVKAMSHQILVMKQGRVVESGDATELFDAPKEPYTKALLDAAFG